MTLRIAQGGGMRPRFGLAVAGLAAMFALTGCKLLGGGVASAPPGEAGAKSLLEQFLKPGANYQALSAPLKPSKADVAAVYQGELGEKLATRYDEMWAKTPMVIKPNPGQTELVLFSATSEELKAGTGKANDFPGGYKRVVQHLKPGLKLYRWKFVKPGETLGMAFDGLVHVNGRWVILPKPWMAAR
jgi:hypothetical protein